MAQYTLTLRTKEDYQVIRKLLKAFDGASIKPLRQTAYTIDQAIEEAKNSKTVGPFKSTQELMADLLD